MTYNATSATTVDLFFWNEAGAATNVIFSFLIFNLIPV